VHLTTARNALARVTELPEATQLVGDTRTEVSHLINNFNALITRQDNWRESYDRVEQNLNVLIGPAGNEDTVGVRRPGDNGPVGTSGISRTLDPIIRDQLIEFRRHLERFEKTATGGTDEPPRASDTPPVEPEAPPPTPPEAENEQRPNGRDVPVDPQALLQHVEALEVILGAHVAAQAAAQKAAGGEVVTNTTPSGSTRTTITPSDVTLNQLQLKQLNFHLRELRRLIEKR
jgi:hypothetical protein